MLLGCELCEPMSEYMRPMSASYELRLRREKWALEGDFRINLPKTACFVEGQSDTAGTGFASCVVCRVDKGHQQEFRSKGEVGGKSWAFVHSGAAAARAETPKTGLRIEIGGRGGRQIDVT